MNTTTAEEQEERDEQERTTIKKQLLLEALDKGRGIMLATSQAGINRTTYYAWRKSDSAFKKQVDFIRSKKADVLEDAVMAKAIGGDMQALKILLPVYHPAFKVKRHDKKEVHIHYHHGVKPGAQPQRTIEDFLDVLDAEESGVAGFTTYSTPVPVDIPEWHKPSPAHEDKVLPKVLKEASETPRERRKRSRKEKK